MHFIPIFRCGGTICLLALGASTLRKGFIHGYKVHCSNIENFIEKLYIAQII